MFTPALLFPPPNTRVTSCDAAALLWALKDNPPLPRMTWLWSAEEETLTGTCLYHFLLLLLEGKRIVVCRPRWNTRDEEEQKRERDVERRKSQQHARHDRMRLLLFSRAPPCVPFSLHHVWQSGRKEKEEREREEQAPYIYFVGKSEVKFNSLIKLSIIMYEQTRFLLRQCN